MAMDHAYLSNIPNCDVCKKREAQYDAPAKNPRAGSGYMCVTCYVRHGIQGEGTILHPAEEDPRNNLRLVQGGGQRSLDEKSPRNKLRLVR